MSSNIDERIVQMTFDNTKFEKGVAQTIKSLDKLKDTLDLDDANDSLSDLQKTANNLNLERIANSVDKIASRFTLLGQIIDDARRKFANMIESMAKETTIGQIVPGFRKYADATQYKRTLLAAVNFKNADKTAAENEAIVQKALDELNKYSDMTSYSYTEMTNSIGKFVSAGVDIEKATAAVKGIGNLTSRSGQTKTQMQSAMYNFAQALSTGSVKLMDWKSIENANLATQEFKATIIKHAEAMGKLKKVSDGVWKTTNGTKVTVEQFNDTLAKGWFTSDVLIDTLKEYSDTSTELGAAAYAAASEAITFAEAIEAVKDAVSTGWATSFKYIFGDLTESTTLWTDFCNAIIDVTSAFDEWRNGILKDWAAVEEVVHVDKWGNKVIEKVGGYQSMINGLYNIFAVIRSLIIAVKDALFELFPDNMLDTLMNVSTAFENWTENLKEQFHVIDYFDASLREVTHTVKEFSDEYDHALKKGDKDSEKVKKMQEALIAAGYSDLLGKAGADGIFGKGTEAAVKAFQEANGLEMTGIYDEDTWKALEGAVESAGGEVANNAYMLTDKATEFKEIAQGLFAVLRVGWDIIKGIFSVAKKLYSAVLEPLLGVVWDFLGALGVALTDTVKTGEEMGFIAWIFEKIGDAISLVNPLVKKLAEILSKIFSAGAMKSALAWMGKAKTSISEWAQRNGILEKAASGWTKFKASASKAFEGLVPTFKKIRGVLSEKFKTVIQWLGEHAPGFLEKAGNGIKWFISEVITPLTNRIPGYVSKAWSGLQKIFGNVTKAIRDFFSVSEDGTGPVDRIIAWFDKLREKFANNPIVTGVIDTIKKVVTSVTEFFSNMFNGGLNIKADGTFMDKALDAIENFFKNLFHVDEVASTAESAVNGVSSFFGSIFNTLGNVWKTIKGTIGDIWNGVKEFTGVDDAGGLVNLILSALGGVGALSLLKSITKLLKNTGEVVSGFDKLGESVTKFVDGATKMLNIGEKIAEIPEAITGMFKNISQIFTVESITKIKKAQPTALSIMEIAVAIGIIAAAIYFLGQMDINAIQQGLILVGGILLLIGVVTVAMSKLDISGTVPKTLLAFAAALGIIVGIIALLSIISVETLLSGMAKLTAIMLMMAFFIKLLAAASKMATGKDPTIGLIRALGGMIILVGLIWIVGHMNMSVLIQGMIGMVGIMTIMLTFIALFNLVGRLANTTGGTPMKGFATLAGAVLILVAAIYLIGHMDPAVYIAGIIGLTGVLLELLAFIVVLDIVGGKTGNSQVAIKGILAMSAGILLLVGAIFLLGHMKWATIGKGLVGLAGIMVLLGVFLVAYSKFASAASGLKTGQIIMATITLVLVLAAAITSLVIALQYVKKIDWKVIASFAGGLAAMMLALGVLEAVSSGSIATVGKTLIMMVGLVALMAGFAFVLKMIPTNINWRAIEAFSKGITEMLIGISVAAAAASLMGLSPMAIVALGAMMLILVGTLYLIFEALSTGLSKLSSSNIDAKKIQVAIDAVEAIVELSKSLAPLSKNDVAFAAATGMSQFTEFCHGIGAFGENVKLLGDSLVDIPDDLEKKVKKAVAAVKPIVELANSLDDLSMADAAFAAVTEGQTKFSSFVNTIGLFVDTVNNELVPKVSLMPDGLDDKVQSTCDSVTPIVNLSNSLKPLTNQDVFYALFTDGKTQFESFIEDIGAFAMGILKASMYLMLIPTSGLDKFETASTAAGYVAGLANGLEDLSWESVAFTVLNGGKDQFQSFCDNLPLFAANMLAATLTLSIVPQSGLDKFDAASTAAGKIADLANGLKDLSWESVAFTALNGGVDQFGEFCDNLFPFAMGMVKASLALMLVPSQGLDKFEDATTAAGYVRDLSNGLAEIKITDAALALFGVKGKFATFCDDMVSFGESVNSLASNLEGLDSATLDANVSDATAITTKLAEFVDKISTDYANIEKNKTGIVGWFGGEDTTFNTLMSNIGSFGSKIGGFAASLGEIGGSGVVDNTESAIGAMRTVAKFISDLSSSDEFASIRDTTDGNGIFSSSLLTSFLSGVEDMMKRIGKIKLDDPEKVSIIADLVDGFGSMLSGAKGEGINTDDFLANFDAEAAGARIIEVATAISEKVSEATTILDSSTTNFNDAGSAIGEGLTSAVEGSSTDMQNSGAGLAKAVENGFSSYDFTTAGKYAGAGLADGLTQSADKVRSAGSYLAGIAEKAVRDKLGIQSPSRVFMALGRFSNMGFANGMLKYSDVVSSAASDVGNDALSSTKSIISNLANAMNADLDGDPVIRPVVDLSNVSKSADTISSMLSGSRGLSVGMASGLVGTIAGQNREAAIQNGSTTNNAYNSPISFAGANFNVRSDSDIRNLAIEIANVSKREQQARGIV